MKHIITLTLIALTGLFLCLPAQAMVCGPYEGLRKLLIEKHRELVKSAGLTTNGSRMIQLYVSEKGSWTILMAMPNGNACIVLEGQRWQSVDQPS